MTMLVSTTDVANMALAHVGAKGRLSNIDEQADRSPEALRIRQFWQVSLESTLRAFDWAFARRYIVGALLAEPPPPHWTYWYTYPEECLAVRRLLPEGYIAAMEHKVSGQAADPYYRDTSIHLSVPKVPYEIVTQADGRRAIATHAVNATVHYTRFIDTAELWDPLFADAFAYHIAMKLVPSLAPATGRPRKTAELLQLFREAIDIARVTDANESFEDRNREAPWIGMGV